MGGERPERNHGSRQDSFVAQLGTNIRSVQAAQGGALTAPAMVVSLAHEDKPSTIGLQLLPLLLALSLQ